MTHRTGDAAHLEHRWGIPVAFEMLAEGLITPDVFAALCEESAAALARNRPSPPAASAEATEGEVPKRRLGS